MKKILLTIGIIAALAIAWWLAAPLFYDTKIDETLPITTGETSMSKADAALESDMTRDMSADGEEDYTSKIEKEVTKVEKTNIVKSEPVKTIGNAVNTVKEESKKTVETIKPKEVEKVITEKATQVKENVAQSSAVETETKVVESVKTEAANMPIQANMSVEKHGMFVGADRFHKGEGQLLVVREGDKTFLRFEDFKVTNGPDLFISLNEGTSPKGNRKLIGKLKASTGNQNYDVSEYNLDDYKSVSVYCRAFFVNFATAQLN